MIIKKNILISLGLVTIISLILMSCEGSECSTGVVIDSNTKEPIDSVLCVSNGGDKVYTDSFGRFEEICSPFGGCMPKCSELEVEFSKEGYNNLKETDKFDTIFLEKLDTID